MWKPRSLAPAVTHSPPAAPRQTAKSAPMFAVHATPSTPVSKRFWTPVVGLPASRSGMAKRPTTSFIRSAERLLFIWRRCGADVFLPTDLPPDSLVVHYIKKESHVSTHPVRRCRGPQIPTPRSREATRGSGRTRRPGSGAQTRQTLCGINAHREGLRRVGLGYRRHRDRERNGRGRPRRGGPDYGRTA